MRMRNRNQEALLMLFGGIFLAVLATGQEKRQEWTLKPSGRWDKLQFTVEIIRPHHHTRQTNDVSASRFRGLPADPFGTGGAAKFEYVQDAGKFLCQGRFSRSKGSGTFAFVPNPQFPAELEKLGFSAPNSDQMFQMMLAGVGLDFARTVKDAGLHASTDQLLEMRNHGVTVEYIQEVRKAGYDGLAAADYIRMRDHGVQPAFLSDLRDAGYDLPVDRIVNLRNHGVNSRYLAELKERGLKPDVDEIIQLRNHGVTPEYMKAIEDAGYDNLTAQQVTRMRQHGVPAEFAQDAKELGYNFTPEELVEMRNHGVNSEYLRRLRDSGMKNLTASQISKLKSHGVD